MIDLNIEAEKYDKSKCKHFKREHTKVEVYDSFNEGFIIGASSKFVKQLIIQAQIDILEGVDGECYYNIPIYKKIEELKQQLKQLDDENNF